MTIEPLDWVPGRDWLPEMETLIRPFFGWFPSGIPYHIRHTGHFGCILENDSCEEKHMVEGGWNKNGCSQLLLWYRNYERDVRTSQASESDSPHQPNLPCKLGKFSHRSLTNHSLRECYFEQWKGPRSPEVSRSLHRPLPCTLRNTHQSPNRCSDSSSDSVWSRRL